MTKAREALAGYGFEPDREVPDCVRLRNCVPELVCGLNHAFLSGFLAGLQARSVEAVLEPRPGECCVSLHST
ncbi:hypothetical protein [Saccharopolyspora sp. NPDC002376]